MADPNSRVGLSYAAEGLLEWLAETHASHSKGLAFAFSAPARAGMPEIMVAPSEGKLLTLLLRLVAAKNVVEVGTLAGYSTLRLAEGLSKDGVVHTIEFEAKHAAVAAESFSAAGMQSQIVQHVGAALEVLPTLAPLGPFDAVFIDADKANYDHYGRWAAQNLRTGGLLLGDNAFFFGRLLDNAGILPRLLCEGFTSRPVNTSTLCVFRHLTVCFWE